MGEERGRRERKKGERRRRRVEELGERRRMGGKETRNGEGRNRLRSL